MTETKSVDVRDAIMDHIEADDRTLAWLAQKTGFNYNTLYSTFKQKVINLTPEKLQAINELLGTDFKS